MLLLTFNQTMRNRNYPPSTAVNSTVCMATNLTLPAALTHIDNYRQAFFSKYEDTSISFNLTHVVELGAEHVPTDIPATKSPTDSIFKRFAVEWVEHLIIDPAEIPEA